MREKLRRAVRHISGAGALASYIYFLYRLWHLCQYGGLRRHLLGFGGLAMAGAIFLLCLAVRIATGIYKPRLATRKIGRVVFIAELVIFLAASAFWGAKIVESGMKYNGALSWKVDELFRKRQVKLRHDNVLDDGVDGIMEDLNRAFVMPGTLYLTNTFSVTFDSDGQIQEIYAFLYGEGLNGKKKTYLVSYDSSQSAKMTVWKNGNVTADYVDDSLLDPMFEILDDADWEEIIEVWNDAYEDAVYKISYSGMETFTSRAGLMGVASDEWEEAHRYTSLGTVIGQLSGGGQVDGYAVKLDVIDKGDAKSISNASHAANSDQADSLADYNGVIDDLNANNASKNTGSNAISPYGSSDAYMYDDAFEYYDENNASEYYDENNASEFAAHITCADDISFPIYYILDPEYTSQLELSAAHEEEQEEEAAATDGWLMDSSTGTMYFFLDEATGWKLSVIDAALGSRFYDLSQTPDGGATWDVVNDDPFLSRGGVAEGLVFYDENTGIAGLSNASADNSALYLTADGGLSFEKIALPYGDVDALPDSAVLLGYAADDYDYLQMPVRDGDVLYVTATSSASEKDGIVFASDDFGASWTYVGTTDE